MDLKLINKNAIVCASSQGLGKAAAIDLALEGVNLAICSRDQKKIDKTTAQKIWQTLENFAKYGFNKAHSTSYAAISYQGTPRENVSCYFFLYF